MIYGSEKRNRQLAFELQNSHVCEKRSKSKGSILRKNMVLGGWRQPSWRHNLTFSVNKKLEITWSTIEVYLVSLVKKWKEMQKMRRVGQKWPIFPQSVM